MATETRRREASAVSARRSGRADVRSAEDIAAATGSAEIAALAAGDRVNIDRSTTRKTRMA